MDPWGAGIAGAKAMLDSFRRLKQCSDRPLELLLSERLLLAFGHIGAGTFTVTMALGLRLPDGDPTMTTGAVGIAVAGAVICAFSLAPKKTLHTTSWVACALLLADLTFFFLYFLRYQLPRAGTDSMVMSYVGAHEVLQGSNPYAAPLSPFFDRFNLPQTAATFRMDGGITDHITYPSLNFLIFLPSVALGMEDIRWVVLAFHGFNVLLIYAGGTKETRLLGVLPLFLLATFVVYTPGSVTDMVWVTFVLLTILGWYRAPRWAAVALGLACSFKQEPWLAIPFLATRRYMEAPSGEGARRTILLLGLSGATFLLLNLPFIILDPGLWMRAVLDPLAPGSSPMVVSGEGLSWTTRYGILGFTKGFYTALTAATLIATLLLYILHFPKLRPALWAFPMVVSLLDYRSLLSHILYWIPPLILEIQLARRRGLPVALYSTPWTGWKRPLSRGLNRQRATVGVLLAAVVVILPAAVHYDGQLHPGLKLELLEPLGVVPGADVIDTLQVRLENPTDSAVRPALGVVLDQWGTAWQPYYWEKRAGPDTLLPGGSADYLFSTPDLDLAIPVETPFHLHVNDAADADSLRVFGPFGGTSTPPLLPNGDFQLWHRDRTSGGWTPYRWWGVKTGSGEILRPAEGGVLIETATASPGFASLSQATPLPSVMTLELELRDPEASNHAIVTYSLGGHHLDFLLSNSPDLPGAPNYIPISLSAGKLERVSIPLNAMWSSRGWLGEGTGELTLSVEGSGASLTLKQITNAP